MSASGTGRVLAVSVTWAVKADPGRVGRTGIDKRPVDVARIGSGGLEGDTVCDETDHGGRDKAVYVYAQEDADWWGGQLDRVIEPGWFGDNLRLVDVDVSGAVVGERWRVGETVVLEVTQPRTPCATFQRHTGEEHWVKRFAQAGRPGAYLRVLEPGAVRPDDAVRVEHRPDHAVPIGRWFLEQDPTDARALVAAESSGLDLAPSLRASVERSLRRA